MVRIRIDKFLHDTGRAILVRVNLVEHWIPKKLTKNVVINNKLSGYISVPIFIAERMGVHDHTMEIEIKQQ